MQVLTLLQTYVNGFVATQQ